jgi:hypothetical protein
MEVFNGKNMEKQLSIQGISMDFNGFQWVSMDFNGGFVEPCLSCLITEGYQAATMLCMPCEISISSGHEKTAIARLCPPQRLMLSSGPDIGQVHEEYHVFHRSVPRSAWHPKHMDLAAGSDKRKLESINVDFYYGHLYIYIYYYIYYI